MHSASAAADDHHHVLKTHAMETVGYIAYQIAAVALQQVTQKNVTVTTTASAVKDTAADLDTFVDDHEMDQARVGVTSL